MINKNTNILQPIINLIELIASNLGTLLVNSFHYLALFLIGAAIVWSAGFEFLSMMDKGAASIEDILLSEAWQTFYDTIASGPETASGVCQRYCNLPASSPAGYQIKVLNLIQND